MPAPSAAAALARAAAAAAQLLDSAARGAAASATARHLPRYCDSFVCLLGQLAEALRPVADALPPRRAL